MSGLMKTEIGSGEKLTRVRNNFDYLITTILNMIISGVR